MKPMILLILLFLISPFVSNATVEIKQKSLTYFENPFLIGDWYFLKPGVENNEVLHISLSSSHKFLIEVIEISSNKVESWRGRFEISQDSIRFEGEGELDESQVYQYGVNHNRLYLNGVEFFKVVPEKIIGSWNSRLLSGEDIMASNVKSLNLKLGSDFIFLLNVVSESGKTNQHIGYYYFEGEDLVLLYEEGEQESTFHIEEDQLEMKNEQFGMYALLVRE